MTRPERRFDDRTVPENRFHIGAPAPGHDNGQRWQYAEGGACVDAGARNVLGVVDTTPICRVRADSDDTRRSSGALESRGQRETACRGSATPAGGAGIRPDPSGVGCQSHGRIRCQVQDAHRSVALEQRGRCPVQQQAMVRPQLVQDADTGDCAGSHPAPEEGPGRGKPRAAGSAIVRAKVAHVVQAVHDLVHLLLRGHGGFTVCVLRDVLQLAKPATHPGEADGGHAVAR